MHLLNNIQLTYRLTFATKAAYRNIKIQTEIEYVIHKLLWWRSEKRKATVRCLSVCLCGLCFLTLTRLWLISSVPTRTAYVSPFLSDGRPTRWHCQYSMQIRLYARCNCRVSVCLSVCPSFTWRCCGSMLSARPAGDIHRESKKQDTKLMPITSPNVNRFSKFFTGRLGGKFATNSHSNIPPQP